MPAPSPDSPSWAPLEHPKTCGLPRLPRSWGPRRPWQTELSEFWSNADRPMLSSSTFQLPYSVDNVNAVRAELEPASILNHIWLRSLIRLKLSWHRPGRDKQSVNRLPRTPPTGRDLSVDELSVAPKHIPRGPLTYKARATRKVYQATPEFE